MSTSKIISIQPSAYTDYVTEDGTELQRLPYPFHVREDGTIGRQDFWKGDPARLIGFAARLDEHKIDLSFADFWKDPQRAVNMYAVTSDSQGNWGTHTAAIESVSETDEEGQA